MKKALLFLPLLVFMFLCSCKSICKFPITDASSNNLNDSLIGNWKFEEDTNKNNFYEVFSGYPGYETNMYHVKFWNRGGTNPTYESIAFLSKIGGATFINVGYSEYNGNDHNGYLFLKILSVNKTFTKMTTTTVHDTTLWTLNQKQLQKRIIENLNNPAYYYDTVHFYKVK